MTKRMSRHSRILPIIICILFLVGSTAFVFLMASQNRDRNKNYLQESAEQKSKEVATHIRGNWETLNGVAVCIGNWQTVTSEELMNTLKQINDQNSFIRMGFISADGRADLVDIDGTTHQNVDMSDEEFFQGAMSGEYTVSTTYRDGSSSNYINYYGAPVSRGGETIGVLCAVNLTNTLTNIINQPIFYGGGFSHIIQSDGRYVVRSTHVTTDESVTNIKNMGVFSDHEIQGILQDLKGGKQDLIAYSTSGNDDRWAYYVPVGVNDWYILSVVPTNVINGDYTMVLGVVLIIGVALLIFTFLFFRISRISEKGKKELEQLAYFDGLTGYSNHEKFLLDAGNLQWLEKKQRTAFWYCDIKKFKFFNDLYGYSAGDQVLCYLADLLAQLSGEDDLFCRVAADNFVGIRFYNTQAEIVQWCELLTSKMKNYETQSKIEYHFGLSIGLFCPDQTDRKLSVNDLLNRANMAQKSIKLQGDVSYSFYTENIRNQALMDTEMENRMRQALKDGEFQIYIQPKVDIQHGNQIAGGEVLSRWTDTNGKLIPPSAFIPLFEKNGFIVDLDRYMFEEICKWLRNYIDEGNQEIKIATNVSRLGLFKDDFLDYYIHIKEKYRIPDYMLELEFTESIVLNNAEIFSNLVIELQKNGFICSLDDFGTGYSSLNILKDLPIQVLKLDMLFFRRGIDDGRAEIVVRNVIVMAEQLQMKTVSEGVETFEQVEFLRTIGCDVVQGYVFAKPMPLEKFEKLLKENPAEYA